MFYVYFIHAGHHHLIGQTKTAENAAGVLEAMRNQMGNDWSDFLITDEER